MLLKFENFEIISDFDIRYSDFHDLDSGCSEETILI